MPLTRRRSSITILPLIIAVAFAAYQYFGAEKVTIPETGRVARVALSPEQENARQMARWREPSFEREHGKYIGPVRKSALRRASCLA